MRISDWSSDVCSSDLQLLAEYPENATALGLDTGARAVLKSQLTDRSPEGRRRLAAAASGRLAQLKAIDTSGLDPQTRIHVEVVRAAHEPPAEGFAFPVGHVVPLSPARSLRHHPQSRAPQ